MLGQKTVRQNSPCIVDKSVLSGRALLLGNGPAPTKDELIQLRSVSNAFIAIDGGANTALSYGLPPDIIIGDCDSVDEKHLTCLPFHRVLDQETNDLEKAFQYCLDHEITKVLIVGGIGDRLDHTLTNLSVLARFSDRIDSLLLDEKQMALICPVGREVIIKGIVGDYLSLFPLHTQVGPVTLSGVAYPFENLLLDPMVKIGTLNRIVEDEVCLFVSRGQLLLMVPRALSLE